MAITYSQPQKENREENDFHLFTGAIMDPFKTGPTGLFATALVPLGKSGRFHLVWYQNRPQLQTGQFPLTQRVSSQWPRFNQLPDGRNCLKTVYGESVLTQIAKIKMTGSIIGPVGKKKKKINKRLKKLK